MMTDNEREAREAVRNTESTVRTVYCLTKRVPDENYDVYVGSTSLSLAARLSLLKSNARQRRDETTPAKVYKRMNEVGLKNWKIVPLLTLECTKEEIRFFERKWCELLEADLNTNSPFVTLEEDLRRRRARYAANRKEILEKVKAYYAANREKVKERNAAYYAANREKILKRAKARYAANREANREKGKK